MVSHLLSDPALAATVTRAASRQTYYTIRCLVDKGLVDDAYRAYAYFRWVDDWLDQEMRPRAERLAFVERQQALMNGCARGQPPADLTPEERWLADLIRQDTAENSRLQLYIRNLMAVMAFDADRRGRLISQAELNQYTRWLAVAVTEAMHYFIGHADDAPHGRLRYVAVAGAHITHMLRDAVQDAQAGYYNTPREVMAAYGITPGDVASPAYQDWVKERVREARACFRSGRDYLAHVENLRCRIAGYAYTHRFQVTLDCIEREGCLLRAHYPERKSQVRGVEMMAWALWMALKARRPAFVSAAFPVR